MSESEKTILIVDDEPFIRQSFADYFEDHLWRPVQAESGERALELMEKESPAGAIVDIRMGGMDGNSFIREAVEKNTKMVFVICTGSPEYDVPPDLKKLPCVSDQLFRKPVTDMDELEKEFLRTIERMEGGAVSG
ncbi:MAG: response regulator [Desulfobacterales bacterium]|nr:response regulator [Desulfobacterales bacterium]